MMITLEKQKNVNITIKDGLPIIGSTIIEALTTLDKMEDAAKRQSPQQPRADNQKPQRTTKSKKRERASSDGGDDTPAKKVKKEDRKAPSTSNKTAEAQKPWQLAAGRKAKKKEKKNQEQDQPQQLRKKAEKTPRRRGDAIVVRPEPGKTYAEILGQIKARVKPEELNTEVKYLSKTKEGGVLIGVGKSDDKMESLKTAIQTAIGKVGTVRGKISRITLEIRDIDSLTTPDDVRSAITAETGEEDAKVHLFEPNTREQRVAVAEIDQIKTTALLKKGKIRIGCINCRVRVRANPTRCYRCLGYGHVKVRCKGPDRSVNC
ncbi:uncharacterized protein LOC116416573 [Nasonia vitripennis]|uniref:Gag-like protein n=1 Tax=Nasonia vitripennis TaxID=7425 RepID=A0A7M7Q830_NASVI|nr:uncharacterized protein LOC116416573 [Nasonia vitripennis]